MKAITLSEVGAAPKISDNIEIPEPGEGEILVKVLYTAINPVYVVLFSTQLQIDLLALISLQSFNW